MKKVKATKLQVFNARFEAMESCIIHLDLDWTDDPIEREAGAWLQDRLKAIQTRMLGKWAKKESK